MKRRLTLASVALASCAAPALARDTYDYGPPPDWARYRELGDAAVRAKLPDPANWAVEWPNGYAKLSWHHKGTFHGYFTCAVLHATAPVKGVYPRVNFVALIDRDRVQEIDISHHESNSLVNVMCDSLVDRGNLPPASLMGDGAATRAAPVAGAANEVPTLGLEVRPMPEGAYILSVKPGSPASDAKLVPGTVIARANGIALGGLGDAVTQVLSASDGDLVLETVTGQRLTLRPLRATGAPK